MANEVRAETFAEQPEHTPPVSGEAPVGTASLLRPFVDNITDYAIFMLDANGHVASWNAGARRIKGYEEREIIGRHFSAFYPQDGTQAAVTRQLLADAVRDGHATHEGWRVRKNGESFWANVVITAVVSEGKLVGFSKITRDLTERKLTEDQLRLSEERYRLLVDGVREYAIFGLDVEGKVTSWNAGAERTNGYRAQEIIGKHVSIFFPVLDIAAGAPRDELRTATEQGRFECEGWRLRKDGTRFWAHVVVTAIFDGQRLLGFSKVIQDVSERRRTEEALRQSEERYRLLVAGVRDYAILALDREGTVVSWNAGAERIKGWTEQEIVGRHFSAFYPPSEIAAGKPLREIEIATSTGRFEEEGLRVRKDGTRFWAHVVLTAVKDGEQVVGFSKVTRDITERRKAEASLQNTRHLLEASHSMTKLGGWELDLLTDEMRWTDETYRIHEVEAETYRPSLASWLSFFEPEAIGEIGEALQRAMLDGKDFSLELKFATAKGRAGWMQVTSRVVREGDRPVRIAGAIQDISSQKAAELAVRDLNATLEQRVRDRTETIHQMNARLLASERELKAQAQQLAEARDAAVAANRVTSSLLANLSHEIRTPLAAVIGLADVLASGVLDTEQREIVRTLRTSGAGLLDVLNDMLDFSKIEAGELRPETTSFSLVHLLEEAVDVVALAAAAKGLDLALEIADDVPADVAMDPRRLKQILVNLLGNAVKFTDRGEIVLAVTRDQGVAAGLCLIVRDTGIGISKEEQRAIFEPFRQLDASSARAHGGTGLGLSLCRALCAVLGGGLTVESEVGRGASFVVRVPHGVAAESPQGVRSLDLRGWHVVLAQPPGSSRGALARQLGRWGARVTETAHEPTPAAGGDDLPDLVIVDSACAELGPALLGGAANEPRGAKRAPTILLRWRGAPLADEERFAAVLWKPPRVASLRAAIERASGEGADEPETVGPARAIASLRVLLVEDDATIRIVTTHQLSKLGHHTTVVADAHAALRELETGVFHAVLTDVQLPGLDGLELTRRLRQAPPAGPRPWIIAMTANALEGDRDRCLAAGMDDYLAKPVELGALQAALALAAASTAQPPALDPAVLRELETLGRETQTPLLAKILGVFLEHAPRELTALDRAIESGDLTSAQDITHKLRGSCDTIGATSLAQALRSVEQATTHGDRPASATALARAREAMVALTDSIERSLASSGAHAQGS